MSLFAAAKSLGKIGAFGMRIGVLSLQGDVKEHISMLRKCGAEAIEIKLPEQLDNVEGLIIPGGESTVMSMLMKKFGLDKKIKQRFSEGMAIYGTCAGAILLAKNVAGHKNFSLGLMDITVKRNDYGRQIDSFEANLNLGPLGNNFNGVFIRAPVIEKVGRKKVEILSEFKGRPVMVKQGNLLATTFHPELNTDKRAHNFFIEIAKKQA